MNVEIAREIQSIMIRLRDLEKEKSELRTRLGDDDLKELRERLSPRCICMTVDSVMKDINDEIHRIKTQLHEFVGGYDYKLKSNAKSVMQQLVDEVLERLYGDMSDFPNEQRIVIDAKIEEAAGRLVSKMR